MELLEFVVDVFVAVWSILGWLISILLSLIGNLMETVFSWFC